MDLIKQMNTQDRFMYLAIGAGLVTIGLQIWSIL